MIPAFGFGDVLPPFVGDDATGAQLPRSPYPSTTLELAEYFCATPERASILRGFLGFRQALRENGFTRGFQWIDGSFVENCEAVKGRPPGDVDVVSLLHRPDAINDEASWVQFLQERIATLFDSQWAKNTYNCDSYFIDLDGPPQSVAEATAYWVGLFSHQRDTFRWKGMIQIPLDLDDTAAAALIDERVNGW